VTVGIMRGGTRANIIPAEVELMGTVRAYNPEVQDLVERRMREILDGITRAAGGSFELRYSRGVPPTVNDTALTERMVPSLGRAVGAANVGRIEPWMASEDFAFFANRIPALFFRLGTLKPGTTSGDHHAPDFMADDGAIPVGVKAMAYVVWDYLAAGGGS
jgi:amidohydrolase